MGTGGGRVGPEVVTPERVAWGFGGGTDKDRQIQPDQQSRKLSFGKSAWTKKSCFWFVAALEPGNLLAQHAWGRDAVMASTSCGSLLWAASPTKSWRAGMFTPRRASLRSTRSPLSVAVWRRTRTSWTGTTTGAGIRKLRSYNFQDSWTFGKPNISVQKLLPSIVQMHSRLVGIR